MAEALPTLESLVTVSPLRTLPMFRRFIRDGFGSLRIHSGTVEPD